MDLFSPRHLLIILVIVLLVFGTKKLKTIGSDLGGAVKGFKNAMNEGQAEAEAEARGETPRIAQTTTPPAPAPADAAKTDAADAHKS